MSLNKETNVKKSACKVGKFCIHEDRKVQILTEVRDDGTVSVGYDLHGKTTIKNVYCVDLEPISATPDWVVRAIRASEDFNYGVEREIKAIWSDNSLTDKQKEIKIERLMVNARRQKWG